MPSKLLHLAFGDPAEQILTGFVRKSNINPQTSFCAFYVVFLLKLLVWGTTEGFEFFDFDILESWDNFDSFRKQLMLSLGREFNKPLRSFQWPSSLITLAFGRDFNQCLGYKSPSHSPFTFQSWDIWFFVFLGTFKPWDFKFQTGDLGIKQKYVKFPSNLSKPWVPPFKFESIQPRIVQ